MQNYKFITFFVIVTLIANIITPFSVIASSEKEEKITMQSDKKSEEHRSENAASPSQNEDKKPQEQSTTQNNFNTSIAQTGSDEGDNRHPSGKDRSVEHGKSETQGKSNSDPDGTQNSYGGNSGKDKLGYDAGLDKGDQDGNNGCGNDDDFEDDNNGNCKGKDKKDGKDTKNDKSDKKDENSSSAYIAIVNNSTVNNNTVNNNTNNQTSTVSQSLGASTLAATGDFPFRFALASIITGAASFILGLFSLSKKAYSRVFNRTFQPYLYVYEARNYSY